MLLGCVSYSQVKVYVWYKLFSGLYIVSLIVAYLFSYCAHYFMT